jgi:protein dithiol oxidoreductase (disulfide-forming)
MNPRRAFLSLTVLLAGAAGASALTLGGALTQVGQWRAGQNYNLVENPQPPSVASGKVEVSEVFWYGCGHCFALDPVLEEWKGKKASYVEFVRVPVIWGPQHRQHAKLYYTLQALGRLDLHPKVFEAIHQQGIPLADRDEVKARALQFGFLSSFGISEQQFDAAFDSMSVVSNMQRAQAFTKNFNVSNVPLIFVNGKYVTSVSEAGGAPQLVALINDLAASEIKR